MDSVGEIKSKLSIEEVISEYVSLKSAGVHLKALCPFHHEKTPSFIVTPERGTFHCFGCGKHGDIFTFVQEIEGIDFKEALKKLADKAGVEVKYTPENKNNSEEKEEIFRALKYAEDFFIQSLNSNTKACKYLQERGLNKEIINTFKIGYAAVDWDALHKYLLSLGVTNEVMLKAGLIKKSDNSNKHYDRFRNRIMFPIHDITGKVVAFTGRTLEKRDDIAKYMNSPETPVFHKSDILYAFHLARDSIRKLDFVIIAEGQFDVIAMHMAGFKNTVAISGTALSENQVLKLSRFTKNVLFALDSDDAGINSMLKYAPLFYKLNFDIKVLHLDDREDPADLFAKDTSGILIKDRVKHSKDFINFCITRFKNLHSGNRYVKILRSRVVPILASMDSQILRERKADDLSKALSVSKEAVLQEIGTHNSGLKSVKTPSEKKSTHLQIQSTLNRLIVFYLWLKSKKDDEIALMFVRELDELDFDFKAKVQEYQSRNIKLEPLFIKLDLEYAEVNLKEVAKELLRLFKIAFFRKKIKVLQEELSKQEMTGNDKKSDEIVLKIKDIQSKLTNIT